MLILCSIPTKTYETIFREDCREQVSLVERVMFSDYSVIGKFADTCKNDILTHKCGRGKLEVVPQNPEEAKVRAEFSYFLTLTFGLRSHLSVFASFQFLPTSQGSTIECLSRVISNVTENCAIEILRVAELQADDYHLDRYVFHLPYHAVINQSWSTSHKNTIFFCSRALYFACRDDREIFCKDVPAGNGKVYRCLLENKMQNRMSESCRGQLLRRQKLTAQDFK